MAVLIGDAFQGHDHQATPLIEGDGHCVPCWLTARNVAPAVLRTLRPLIAGEAVAAERARIADAVHELATNGLEGDLAASALIHVSQLIKDNEL